jgi:hypothetical protein
MLRALNPTAFATYVQHALFAFTEPSDFECLGDRDPCCGLSSGVGEAYGQLSDQTGGIRANLCDQDFEPVWAALATQVVDNAALACDWAIPPPPDGKQLNTALVNVQYSGTGQAVQRVGFVPAAADCGKVANGWYYDDRNPPTRVLMCPQTCAAIQLLNAARVEIEFGCMTQVAPPE